MTPEETPTAQAQVQPSTARLGDLVTLDIRVTHPPALAIEPPAFTQSLGDFEVYASSRLPADRAGEKWVDRYQAQLQSFATGQHVLPGVDVSYRDPMGRQGRLKTPALTVFIEEVPPGPHDKGTIRGIKGVIGPVAWSAWWWAAIALGIAGIGWILWRKRKRVLEGPPPPPPVPPPEAALKKLRELEASGWLEAGKTKEFYVALSDITRAYLEGSFQTPALERTTYELLRELRKKSSLKSSQEAVLKELLEDCDLVKFAKFRPAPAEGRKRLAAAMKFVEETTKKEE